jgi:uncharacterized protein
MDSLLFLIEMLILGVGVGLISNALGLGGGVIMVPAFLTFVPEMDIHTAKGTSLFIITFVATFNVWRFNANGVMPDWSLPAMMALGAIIGSPLGAWFTILLSDRAATWIFIGFLALVGVRTFFIEPRPVKEDAVRQRRWLALIIGVIAGIVSGATGTGGGAVMIPLALLAGLVSNERVVAMSNAVMIVAAAAAAVTYFYATPTVAVTGTFGQVNVYMAPVVFLGALVSGPFGRVVNARMTLPVRRVIMGLLLGLIVARLVARAVG